MFIRKLIGRQDKNHRERILFGSILPENIDWNEINDFLKATAMHKRMLLDNWHESEAFITYPISDTSVECLRCLHEDLAGCYGGIFITDEDGSEDIHKEHSFLNEKLHLKYGKLDEDVLKKIYGQYLTDDR